MTAPFNQIEAEPSPAAERIVSVNDIGGPSRRSAAKLLAAVLICCVAAVGALMAINRWRAHANAEAPGKPSGPAAAKEAAIPRRQFGTSPPPPATPAPAASTAPLVGLTCPDGLPSEVFTDQAGTAVLTPTGQPVRLCRSGQLLLPPLPAGSTAKADQSAPPDSHPAPPATPAASAAPAPAPASRYDGDLFLPQPHAAATPASNNPAAAGSAETPVPPAPAAAQADEPPSPRGRPKAALRAAAAPTQARLLGNRNMLLPQGRSIDCNLSLRLVSEISGMAVCVLPAYVYGDSGVVALAEPGSIVTGDYLAIGAQGQRRLYIVWNRLETTQGAVIELNSPAVDALGTAGLDGYVDNRWPERIGAAALLSVVQDAVAYETARASRNGAGGIALFQQSTQAGEQLAQRILDSTINIKPTVYKQQGDRASIMVAHDLDFGSVYVLRTK